MDRSTPDFPVLHHLWSLLTFMSRVGDVIQPSHSEAEGLGKSQASGFS